MEFEWDEGKSAANRAKHGVGFERARQMDLDSAHKVADLRRDYGEHREVAYVRHEGRLFVCVYVLREGRYRIISLRKANSREERKYGR